MKVFLTGASGFIGAHVLRALLDRGHSVHVLLSPGHEAWRLKDLNGQFSGILGRLGDTKLLLKELRRFKPDACIHLAWYAEHGKYLHSRENITSLVDSLNLLQILKEAECGRVVMAGTCAEYDTNFGFLHEEVPTRPATLYAAAKLSCFHLGQQIATDASIKFAWGRIFYPYGPKEDERRVIPAAIQSLLRGEVFLATPGNQIRDYIHVADVANAFCFLVEKEAAGAYNISSGTPITIRQLLETIANIIGCSDLIQFGARSYRAWEPLMICGNNTNLKTLDWQPEYSIHQGLSETINWWKKTA